MLKAALDFSGSELAFAVVDDSGATVASCLVDLPGRDSSTLPVLVGDALKNTFVPSAALGDMTSPILTLLGGTVGGYITFAGAHRLIDAGVTGEKNLGQIRKSSLTGMLVATIVRILLFLAVLGVVAKGAVLSTQGNPAADAFRQGAGEVIFAQSKTPEQMKGIINSMLNNNQKRILLTRLGEDKAKELKKSFELEYFGEAKIGIIGSFPEEKSEGKILVATGGTSDVPVAEEAVLTAEFFGNDVTRLYDVGVAGLHRLLSHLDEIMSANVIIAIAGMEGALASVIGGLADCPVIAVPTSVGYGSSFEGLSALLSMLNSCASGVSVVNIDNGFGAGYLANMINK